MTRAVEGLKRCPCCDGESEVARELARFYVCCTGGETDAHCDLKGPTAINRDDAIAKWNRRDPPPSKDSPAP